MLLKETGNVLLEEEYLRYCQGGYGKQLEKAFPNATKGELQEKIGKAVGDYMNQIIKKSVDYGIQKGSEKEEKTDVEDN